MSKLRAGLTVWGCLACGVTWTCRAEPSTPVRRWQVGDRWVLKVVEYSQGYVLAHSDPDYRYVHEVLQEFPLSAVVTGVVEVKGERCWRVEMNQEKVGAEWIGDMVAGEVFVTVENGLLLRASTLGKRGRRLQPAAAPFGGVVVVDNASNGLPVNLFTAQELWSEGFSREERKEPDSICRVVATRTRTGDSTTVVEVTVLSTRRPEGQNEMVRVRQEWKDGASWWRKHEVWRSGYIEIVATLVDDASAGPEQRTELDVQSAEATAPPLDQPPPTGTVPWLTILVCVGGVVLVCGIGIAILRRRKRRPV